MAVTEDKTRVVTYMDVTVKELAEKLGKKQRRSLSNLIEVAVEDYINRAIADGEITGSEVSESEPTVAKNGRGAKK